MTMVFYTELQTRLTRFVDAEMLPHMTGGKKILLGGYAALDPGAAEKILAMTTRIAAGQKLTCLMVTHNMRAALALGNRTLMMNGGRIVLDVSGEERAHMGVNDLLERFQSGTGDALDNDRILLS